MAKEEGKQETAEKKVKLYKHDVQRIIKKAVHPRRDFVVEFCKDHPPLTRNTVGKWCAGQGLSAAATAFLLLVDKLNKEKEDKGERS